MEKEKPQESTSLWSWLCLWVSISVNITLKARYYPGVQQLVLLLGHGHLGGQKSRNIYVPRGSGWGTLTSQGTQDGTPKYLDSKLVLHGFRNDIGKVKADHNLNNLRIFWKWHISPNVLCCLGSSEFPITISLLFASDYSGTSVLKFIYFIFKYISLNMWLNLWHFSSPLSPLSLHTPNL